MNQIFQVEKQNIYKVNHGEVELSDLQDGEIRLKIDKYALTTNNITYAVSGFKLKYWNFFPTKEPYGIVPVWGYAEVVSSKHEEIKEGERLYGYLPMSTYCTVKAVQINPFGFSDGAEHRQGLAPIYNHYTRLAADPSHNETIENYVPIMKPLFATSFLLYQFLKNKNFLEADQIILTSASSKTALALAFMLHQNQMADGKKIVGLTSKRNVDFVQASNYYTEVYTYEDAAAIKADKAVVVDFSGNFKLLENLSNHLNELLAHIALVGLTDWKAAGGFSSLSKAKFFFAPDHIKEFYKTYGISKANQLLNQALADFINDSKKNISLEFITDKEKLSDLYVGMIDGKVDPKKGYLVKL